MNLKITDVVLTSTGYSSADVVGDINAHTDNLLTNGTVNCDLKWYKSLADKALGYDNIFPTFGGTKIASVQVTLTEAEANAANLPATIYNKVADKLLADYEFVTIVE